MATNLTPPLSMPTQKSVGHDSHAASINAFNLQLRQQPWYQDWFRQQGLDPNHVKLSKSQRQQLEQLIITRGGVPPDAFNDMMIDTAGNLNTEHGFASQPTWLKALEIGGAAAAGGYFAAPAFSGAAPVTAPAAAPSVAGGATSAVPAAMVPSSVAAGSAAPAAGALAPVAGGVAAHASRSIPWAPIVAGAGGALESYGANRAATQRQTDQQAADVEMEQMRETFETSKLDPFRDQNAQGQAIAMADRRQNRMPIMPPAAVQPYMPTGGYTPSQDARDAAGKLKLSVMAGETAPSPLDPANAGRHGTIDATAPLDPATGRAPFAGAPAFSYDPLMNDPSAPPNDPNLDLIKRRLRQRGALPPTA